MPHCPTLQSNEPALTYAAADSGIRMNGGCKEARHLPSHIADIVLYEGHPREGYGIVTRSYGSAPLPVEAGKPRSTWSLWARKGNNWSQVSIADPCDPEGYAVSCRPQSRIHADNLRGSRQIATLAANAEALIGAGETAELRFLPPRVAA